MDAKDGFELHVLMRVSIGIRDGFDRLGVRPDSDRNRQLQMLMDPLLKFLRIFRRCLIAARFRRRMMHDESDAMRLHPRMPYKGMMALSQVAEGAFDDKLKQVLVFDPIFVRKPSIPVQLCHNHA
ncbi:hypothetical protein D3C81_1738960 [compost metagenome]